MGVFGVNLYCRMVIGPLDSLTPVRGSKIGPGREIWVIREEGSVIVGVDALTKVLEIG